MHTWYRTKQRLKQKKTGNVLSIPDKKYNPLKYATGDTLHGSRPILDEGGRTALLWRPPRAFVRTVRVRRSMIEKMPKKKHS